MMFPTSVPILTLIHSDLIENCGLLVLGLLHPIYVPPGFSFALEAFFEHHFGNPRYLQVTSFIASENRQRASQQHSQQPSTVGSAIREVDTA